MANSRFTAISLFTGAGGLDLGFEAAGFRTAVAVEFDPDAINTIRLNRDWAVIDKDIHSENASAKNLLRTAGLHEGEADVLIGGPPCQPFSKSSYWARGDALRLADPRSSTLGAYLRVLRATKPRSFLLENVPGIAFSEKNEGLLLFQRELENINRATGLRYSFACASLRAVQYGVPQNRERVFVVGARGGRHFTFPTPSHYGPGDVTSAELAFHDRKPFLTAWDAIGHLEDCSERELEVTGKWAPLLPSIPEGSNYLFHTPRGAGLPLFGWRRRYWSFLLKLAKALPAWTIAAQPGPAIGPFHWKNRRLSRRELASLQTFPPDYQITGTLRAVQRQLGNAVPSALAQRLALEIRMQLLDDSAARTIPVTLVPSRSGKPPPPEPVVEVPSEYRYLLGNHEPHPGTGKGYGAIRRNLVSR